MTNGVVCHAKWCVPGLGVHNYLNTQYIKLCDKLILKQIFVLYKAFRLCRGLMKQTHDCSAWHREAIKKKTTKFRTLAEKGGVSTAAKLFIEKKYGHMYKGGGGWSSSSKIVFCIKVCYVGP